ncbi:MAG: hypothetical protein RL291_1635 [Pseudomonadota bacterium]
MTTDLATTVQRIEADAETLADRLPDLLMEAQRVALTVAHGLHGRRRAGPGETFWQFRQVQAGDAATSIDWRRSASSDHLFVREREWEAAHTVWLWPDLSPSMAYKSHLAQTQKRDRALLLAFALGEMLVRGSERVALMGVTQPSASRKTTVRMAEQLAQRLRIEKGAQPSFPPELRMQRFSAAIWISDFLDPLEPLRQRISELASHGVEGHLIQVLDPAEETLPYDGRVEFRAVEGQDRWTTDRAEGIKPLYLAKLAAHRDELKDICRRVGWSLLLHRTDSPTAEPLLAMSQRLRGEPVALGTRSLSGGASHDGDAA